MWVNCFLCFMTSNSCQHTIFYIFIQEETALEAVSIYQHISRPRRCSEFLRACIKEGPRSSPSHSNLPPCFSINHWFRTEIIKSLPTPSCTIPIQSHLSSFSHLQYGQVLGLEVITEHNTNSSMHFSYLSMLATVQPIGSVEPIGSWELD